MSVAQTDMPLRDGQAGLYPLFLMKSVHRIHPFIFCMVPAFQPVWCHGETAGHCRNPALFRCFGALNWYHTPILVSLGYHAQPALRADVSPRRRESGVFLSPAIFFDWPHGDPPSYSPGFRRSPASPHPGRSGPVRLFQGRGGGIFPSPVFGAKHRAKPRPVTVVTMVTVFWTPPRSKKYRHLRHYRHSSDGSSCCRVCA